MNIGNWVVFFGIMMVGDMFVVLFMVMMSIVLFCVIFYFFYMIGKL